MAITAIGVQFIPDLGEQCFRVRVKQRGCSAWQYAPAVGDCTEERARRVLIQLGVAPQRADAWIASARDLVLDRHDE